MPFIHFKKNYPSIEVESGALLMQSLLKAGMPVASSCQSDGICGKCKVEVIAGAKNLSAIEDREHILSIRLKIKAPYRISCQTKVFGDVTIDTTYW